MFPKDKNNPLRLDDIDSMCSRDENEMSDQDIKSSPNQLGAIPKLSRSKCNEFLNESSNEELLFAVYQKIGDNLLKRLHFLEALEHYIKEWKRKTTLCITEHEQRDSESLLNLNVSSQEPQSSWTLTLNEFLTSILSSMKHLSREREIVSSPYAKDICISMWDRYRMDFEEICLLGRGGFGSVFKARHRLDGREYAIKKVPLSYASSEECKLLLREVKLLSEMRHPNIAQYFSSWLQCDSSILTSKYTTEELYTSSYNSSHEMISYEENNPDLPRKSMVSSSLSDIIFESSTKNINVQYLNPGSDPSNDINSLNVSMKNLNLSFEGNSNSYINTEDKYLSDHCPSSLNQNGQKNLTGVLNSNSKLEYQNSSSSSSNMELVQCCPSVSPLIPIPTLYIQMELGDISLLSWIEQRNNRIRENIFSWNNKEMENHLKIFRGILLALDYIHSKEVIHRDVKPANILIALEDHRALLADFGLAKLFLSKDLSQKKVLKKAKSQSSWVGTPTYSAPEIVKKSICNFKADIYSLGIILLELMQPFNSMFERAKVIENLKKRRILDSQVVSKWGCFSNLVLSMTDNDPLMRPSASEILYQIDNLYKYFPKRNYTSDSLVRTFSLPTTSNTEMEEKNKLSRKSLKRSKTYTNGINSLGTNLCTGRTSSLESLKRRNFARKFLEYTSLKAISRRKSQIRKLKSKVKVLEKRIEELERR